MALGTGRILVVLIFLSGTLWAKPPVKPGCRYEGRRYQEGCSVNTSEPCLQCRCTDGALRCRLRICPRLPNPPPFGCRVRPPGENVCCAELVCTETRQMGNTLPIEQLEEDIAFRSEGCLHEGVRYGPGSAMMGSRRCEYCYCISGARRCIRPKCLLPLPGCTPLYAPHSCCPVAYNCTHALDSSTAAPVTGNGCRVADRFYKEGEMVRNIEWKAACDNCFCAMGAVRCVPLACAPPLQGCTPIVREGHCCPSTYNCSGSIEVKATQNYASYAFISKDYAKFRKETNFLTAIEQTTNLPVEGRGHRVVEERSDASTIEDSSIASTWPATDIMDNEILVETVDYTKSSLDITTSSAGNDELTTNFESTTPEESTKMEDSTFVDYTTITEFADEATTDPIKPGFGTESPQIEEERVIDANATVSGKLTSVEDSGRGNLTVEPVANAVKPSSTVMMPDDILVMNVTVKTNVSVQIPPYVEAILNVSHREKGEEYEYDYSEPTLPPSLPNVRIIPFVAADALVKEKTVSSTVTGYPSGSVVAAPELRPTDTSGFYDIATQENGFSPPIETEGGFVPREPPYFDAPYRSTDFNLEIGTAAPAAITNPHRKSDGSNCLYENMEYHHGEILPSTTGICVICMCYYGEVVCSAEKCPPLKIGCRRVNAEEGCCGKIVCVEADESPTVVLDRADATTASRHQPMVFRDVIKTEPAPDLPSLIEDMIPYLVEHGITTTPKPSNRFDYVEKVMMRPTYDDYLDGSKYSATRPQDSFPFNHNWKDPDQSAGTETVPPELGDDITRIDYTTKLRDEDIVAENATSSNFTRLNASNDQEIAKPEDSTEDIFSLDSVFDLFFSDSKGNGTRPPEIASATKSSESTTLDTDTSSKLLENEIPMKSLLKLAGCNIYGRMYRVGRIITELSGPCLECRCTEIGVQCNQLGC